MPAAAADLARRRALVVERTRLSRPPAVPELTLHLATDMTQVWQDLERELAQGELPPPFWAFAWLGGQALARYLLDTSDEVRGRRVLDLASGSGLCALAAALAGADEVVAADIDPVAQVAIGRNAVANDVSVRVEGRDLLDDEPPDVDVLLAGDVCYDRDMTARVLPWLTRAAQRGVRVLLGDPGRTYLPQEGLRLLAETVVPTTRDLEGVDHKSTRVYRLG